jgi:hypothetical protein
MSSRLALIAPHGGCHRVASVRIQRRDARGVTAAARPLESTTGGRVSFSSRRTPRRHAPRPPRVSPMDASLSDTPSAFEKLDGIADRPTPASVEFDLLPFDSACVPWTAHMRWVFNRLESALGPLVPVPMDADVCTNFGKNNGKPRVESWVYRSQYARRIRFTYVDQGEEKQIFNAVVYPEPSSGGDEKSGKNKTHNGDCPLLGIDLLCLAKGKNILVGIDLQPLSQDSTYLERYGLTCSGNGVTDDLAAIRDAFGDLNAVTPSKRFYQDARFFSQSMLFARPDPKAMATHAAQQALAAAGVECVPETFADDVCVAEGPGCGTQVVEERTLAAVKAYCEFFLEKLDVANEVHRGEKEEEDALVTNVTAGPDFGAESAFGDEDNEGNEGAAGAEKPKPKSEERDARILSPLETAEAHDAHDAWQKQRDPAIALFENWFGKVWAERMVDEVLFPTGLAVRELEARGLLGLGKGNAVEK